MLLAVIVFILFPNPLLSQNPAHGTLILAIRTPTEIVVAADSKVFTESNLPRSESVCKIRRIADIYFVAHGLYEDIPSGFNLWEIIEQSGANTRNISNIADRFEVLIEDPLKRALKSIKVSSPEFYQEKCIKRAALGVVFFGVESGTLVFNRCRVLVEDSITRDISIRFVRENCPGSLCPEGNVLIVAAEDQDKIELRKLTDDLTPDKNILDFVRNFMTIAIFKNSTKYGFPVDIIHLTADQSEWIQKKQECK